MPFADMSVWLYNFFERHISPLVIMEKAIQKSIGKILCTAFLEIKR